jgi:beta-glucosidase
MPFLKTHRVCLAALLIMVGLSGLAHGVDDRKVHLFILSGQSNMAGLNPDLSFTPTVTKALAPDKVIVVKSAQGGQPIRRWFKQWKPAKGRDVAGNDEAGDLYEKLMSKVNPAIEGITPDTITFVWMQGERDAKEMHGEVYAASLRGLIEQLRTDLKRPDLGAVIGRLSDCKNGSKDHWDMVRAAQVEVAKTDPRVAWVDTDDLNGPKDGLHYTTEGYVELGKRFAQASLDLMKPVPAALKPAPTKWLERHDEKLAEIKGCKKVDLVFLGDSITHCWEQEGKGVWDQYYAKRNALNLGFGGDKTEQVIWRLQHGEGEGYRAKLAVIMIGTNNGGRKDSPEDIAAGIRGIIDQWQHQQPQCKILLLAIFPRGATPADARRQLNDRVNAIICKYADNKQVFFMDIGSKFLTKDGTLTHEIMPDLLHPHEKCYGIWAQAIEPMVKKLLDKK